MKDDLQDLNEYCKNKKKPVVAILLGGNKNEESLVEIARKAQGKSFECIIIYANIENSIIDDDIPKYFILYDNFKHIEGLDIAISLDLLCFKPWIYNGPTKFKHLVLPHSFLQVEKKKFSIDIIIAYSRLLLYADYLFLPHAGLLEIPPESLETSFTNRYPEDLSNRREAPFTIIPGGYLKLDWLREKIEKITCQRDCIVFAPRGLYSNPPNFVEDSKTIISTILDLFPTYKAVFRPLPADVKSKKVKEIIAEFSQNPRFIFDDSATNLDAFAAAAVVITDTSTTAMTYSLLTECPHIRYITKKHSQLNDFSEIHLFETRINSTDQLENALKKCLSDEFVPGGELEDYLINPGRAYDYLFETIENILTGKKDNSWITLQRKFLKGPLTAPEDWPDSLLLQDLVPIPFKNYEKEIIADFIKFRDLINQLFPLFEYPWTGVKINYKTKEFSYLTQEENDFYSKYPEKIPSFMLWGTGQRYIDYYQEAVLAAGESCLGFLDNNPELWGTKKDGHTIFEPKDLCTHKPEIVFVSSYSYIDILLDINRHLSTL